MAVKKTQAVPGNKRTQKSVQKKRDAGLIQAKVWVHPDEADKVRAYAAKQPLTKAINAELTK